MSLAFAERLAPGVPSAPASSARLIQGTPITIDRVLCRASRASSGNKPPLMAPAGDSLNNRPSRPLSSPRRRACTAGGVHIPAEHHHVELFGALRILGYGKVGVGCRVRAVPPAGESVALERRLEGGDMESCSVGGVASAWRGWPHRNPLCPLQQARQRFRRDLKNAEAVGEPSAPVCYTTISTRGIQRRSVSSWSWVVTAMDAAGEGFWGHR